MVHSVKTIADRRIKLVKNREKFHKFEKYYVKWRKNNRNK